MYVKVLLRTEEGGYQRLEVPLPPDLQDFRKESVDKEVTKYLRKKKIECRWWRSEWGEE